MGDFVILSSGGRSHPNYPIKRLIKYDPDNLDKYYFNYFYDESVNYGRNQESDAWVEFDFKFFQVDLFSYTIRSTP